MLICAPESTGEKETMNETRDATDALLASAGQMQEAITKKRF